MMEVWERNSSATGYLIDNRKRQDVVGQIEEMAISYTPEWKFNASDPDAASVIGLIFSNQLMESIKKLNQVLYKYHIEFANMYGVSRKPAIPARTICVLKVGEGMQSGAELKKNTHVVGTTEEGEEVTFAFLHDINAVSSELTDIVEASGIERKVVAHKGDFKAVDYHDMQLYPVFQEGQQSESVSMFSLQGKTIHKQAVVIYFGSFMEIQEQGIQLRFKGNHSSRKLTELFTNREYFTFSYITEEGITNFDEINAVGDFIEIKNKKSVPKVNIGGDKMTAVIIEMKNPSDDNIFLNHIELFSTGKETEPEFMWNGTSEILEKEFLPFTQQPALYQEFFIGHRFFMEQQGAIMTMSFRLQFGRYSPQNTALYEPDLRIVKRKQKKDYGKPHYECCVQKVTFEYFNGKGWRRLPASKDISELFSREDNAGEYDISFNVPSDWENVVQAGYDGKCIRMQIVRADNCYMQDVTYVYPIISYIKFTISEQENGILPGRVIRIQGAKKEDVTEKIGNEEGFNAFTQLQYPGDYVYWGFNRPLGHGPVSVFVELEKSVTWKGLELSFSYSSLNGFKPLKVIDYTDSFQNSGIILFVPPTDMRMYEVEGVERYWIRIEDKNRYFSNDRKNTPHIRNIYMNAVMVENVIQQDEQDYYIDAVTPNMKFSLYSPNILTVQVWVNEKDQLTEEEMKQLSEDSSVQTRAECNYLGEIEEFYVLWHEIDSFENAGRMERCYCIDRDKKELLFGDGVHVRIPQTTNNIAFKTQVLCCDGKKANVKAGNIDRFHSSVISVEGIENPIDAYGGSDFEEMEDALQRGSNILSSRKRLVTERDYIQEVLAFSSVIAQVACVTGVTPTGYQNDSVISLVLLMRDFQKGDYSFKSLQEPLKDYLMNCCEMTCGISDIQIVEPVFVKISLDIWLNVQDISKSLEIKQLWIDRITDFLEPVATQKENGWRIGKLPKMNQIRLMLNALEDTAEITHINILAEYTYNHNSYEVSLDRVEENPFMVCCNGTHNIHMKNSV